jgi:hypothetical protein
LSTGSCRRADLIEGQGNVFFGDPRFGGVIDGCIYAQNNVYMVNPPTNVEPPSAAQDRIFGVNGFLSAGGIMDLGATSGGSNYNNCRLKRHDLLQGHAVNPRRRLAGAERIAGLLRLAPAQHGLGPNETTEGKTPRWSSAFPFLASPGRAFFPGTTTRLTCLCRVPSPAPSPGPRSTPVGAASTRGHRLENQTPVRAPTTIRALAFVDGPTFAYRDPAKSRPQGIPEGAWGSP